MSGHWSVAPAAASGLIRVTMTGLICAAEMQHMWEAFEDRVDALRGRDFRVLVDLRGLAPLSCEATVILEGAKRAASFRPNFRGSAVLVDSPTIALQHRRTSVGACVMDTEIISGDIEVCMQHLSRVHRESSGDLAATPASGRGRA